MHLLRSHFRHNFTPQVEVLLGFPVERETIWLQSFLFVALSLFVWVDAQNGQFQVPSATSATRKVSLIKNLLQSSWPLSASFARTHTGHTFWTFWIPFFLFFTRWSCKSSFANLYAIFMTAGAGHSQLLHCVFITGWKRWDFFLVQNIEYKF